MTVKIQIDNVSKIFGTREKKAALLAGKGMAKEEILRQTGAAVAVRHVTLSVEEGEIFVIMGLSGSGKSTLIRMINRLVTPTEGTISFDGRDICAMTEGELRHLRREKINMVFQGFGLFPNRTVLENVMYGLEVRGVPRKDRKSTAEKALCRVGIGAYGSQYPDQLSGGMQQRVGLARALANDPDVLLMDESFSALDPLIRRDMQEELLMMQKDIHKTIIFVTHDLREALRLGDHIAIMKDGEVAQAGTAEEILAHPAGEYVARFVEGVDRTGYISAGDIMSRPKAVINGERQSLQTALERMEYRRLAALAVTNSNHQFLGYVTDRDAAGELRRKGTSASYSDIIRMDIPTATYETPVKDLYPVLMKQDLPVAVLDGRRRVRGIVTRQNMMAVWGSGMVSGRQGL